MHQLFTGFLCGASHIQGRVFKGGTSLSKAYGVIPRVSEDFNLTYDIRAIAADLIGDSDMPLPATKSQKKKWTKETRAHLSDWVITEIMPRPSRIRLIYSGGISDGAVRHDSSISRMVALSMVPARCSPWAALWIASKASLLNLALLFIA